MSDFCGTAAAEPSARLHSISGRGARLRAASTSATTSLLCFPASAWAAVRTRRMPCRLLNWLRLMRRGGPLGRGEPERQAEPARVPLVTRRGQRGLSAPTAAHTITPGGRIDSSVRARPVRTRSANSEIGQEGVMVRSSPERILGVSRSAAFKRRSIGPSATRVGSLGRISGN